jgi:hypothetical protein
VHVLVEAAPIGGSQVALGSDPQVVAMDDRHEAATDQFGIQYERVFHVIQILVFAV